MPTKKKRVGFIPREDVMKIIDKLSIENNLSNSKIISILVEEALSVRGIFNKKTGKVTKSFQQIKDDSMTQAEDTNDFKEYEFSLTTASSFASNSFNQVRLNTGDSNIATYRTPSGVIHKTYKTFAFKIVLTSTTNASVPFVKDLRAIALQV